MEVKNEILKNLNVNIDSHSSDKELLYEKYKSYIYYIIISIEQLLYKLFCELKLEKNLNSDESEETIHEYIKLYLSEYIKKIENGEFTPLDLTTIEEIKSIKNNDNKNIIIIIEEIINMSYPFLDRSILKIDHITIYIGSISEQLHEIFEINKLDILKLI